MQTPEKYYRWCKCSFYAWAYGAHDHINWLFAQEYKVTFMNGDDA